MLPWLGLAWLGLAWLGLVGPVRLARRMCLGSVCVRWVIPPHRVIEAPQWGPPTHPVGCSKRTVGCSKRTVGWSSRSVRTGSPTHGPTRLTRPRSRHLGFGRAFDRAVLAALHSNATPADAALLHEAWAARAAAATQGRPGAGTRGTSHARPGRFPRSTQPSRSCTQLQHHSRFSTWGCQVAGSRASCGCARV